jgi:hypothetical protein
MVVIKNGASFGTRQREREGSGLSGPFTGTRAEPALEVGTIFIRGPMNE